MKIVAFLQVYNEVAKGNLRRCLNNCKQWADDIVVYDDASTDSSVSVCEEYTSHIIRGTVNRVIDEQLHKQQLLELALTLNPDWIFWIDADEILCREATTGGLRRLAENAPAGVDAYSFPEWNLWRSQTWRRIDSLFATGWFCRLWRVVPGIHIKVTTGVHGRLYPITINNIVRADMPVIHYGFWDYKAMMVKIGAHWCDRNELHRIAPNNWILNETACRCVKTPPELFPVENVPPDIWPEPTPLRIEDMPSYAEIPDPLVESSSREVWDDYHANEYHGNYKHIHERNQTAMEWRDNPRRASMFAFDPNGKVIVDIGCGGGWFAIDCIVNGAAKVYCLEINQPIIDMARRSFAELCIPEDAYEFVLIDGKWAPPEPVDVVYCMAVFMHIPVSEFANYLRLIHDCLKPGGEAHLQFWQQDGKTMFHNDGKPNHETRLLDTEVDAMIANAGLRLREKHYPRGEGLEPVWTFYVLEKAR